jgi:hypothetical protein
MRSDLSIVAAEFGTATIVSTKRDASSDVLLIDCSRREETCRLCGEPPIAVNCTYDDVSLGGRGKSLAGRLITIAELARALPAVKQSCS